MKCIVALLVLSAVVVAVASSPPLNKAKWDIAEGITGAKSVMKKAEGHEESCRQAYNRLTKEQQSKITNPTIKRSFFEANHHPTAMIMGLQWVDMPLGGKSTSKLGDDLTTPTHANAAEFGSLFKLAAAGARNSFISQTHFGCLSFWHAMVPEPDFAKGKCMVWKNGIFAKLIVNGAERVWKAATANLAAGKKDMAEFHLGRLAHTIGDSFAAGHAERDGNCGEIKVFQEYGAQAGNHAHDDGDKPDKNKEKFECAIKNIKTLFEKWVDCVASKKCGFPRGLFESVMKVKAGFENDDAGGATARFKGSKATKEVKGVFFKPLPAGCTRIEGTASPADACAHFK